MNSKFKVIIVSFVVVFFFSAVSCTASAQTLNSAEALKDYLDKQPANSPDKPIKVTMNANASMLEKIAAAINSAGKYVSLNLSGNALTNIPDSVFYDASTRKGCATLIAITIPDSVTSIEREVFIECTNLTSVKFEGTINSGNFDSNYSFPGDLRAKYLVGGIGTYTRASGSVMLTLNLEFLSQANKVY